MKHIFLRSFAVLILALLPALGSAADIDRFVGSYSGSVNFEYEGTFEQRDLSVDIQPVKENFTLSWTSVSYKEDGRKKEKTYTIEFAPSDRPNIYGSQMKTNVFGKEIPLDPLAGEPYVWARIDGDTLTVFSLIIDESGDYEMQEYGRTLVDGGFDLDFRSTSRNKPDKIIEAFLKREN